MCVYSPAGRLFHAPTQRRSLNTPFSTWCCKRRVQGADGVGDKKERERVRRRELCHVRDYRNAFGAPRTDGKKDRGE